MLRGSCINKSASFKPIVYLGIGLVLAGIVGPMLFNIHGAMPRWIGLLLAILGFYLAFKGRQKSSPFSGATLARAERATVYEGRVFDFSSDLDVEAIEKVWNERGPFRWRGSDSEVYGVYLVADIPEYDGKLRLINFQLIARPSDYSLEISFDVPQDNFEEALVRLVSPMLESLLPAVGARNVRETTQRAQGGKVRGHG